MDELRKGIRDINLTEVPYEREIQLRSYLVRFLKDRMTRRELLKAGGLTGLSLSVLWALACQPAAPAPTPTKTTAVVAPTPAAPTPTKAPVPTPTKKPTRPQELVWGTDEPKTLDANLADADGWAMCREIYRPLVRFEYNSTKIIPDMAKEWSVSPDGITYTFKLRNDVKWQKGYGAFTSKDVVFSFERMQDPATKSLWRPNTMDIERIEATDEYTVKLVLKKPFAGFIQFLVNKMGWITCQKAVKELGPERYSREPVGTGPYILKEWVSKDRLTFVANEEWYSGSPTIKKMTVRIIYEKPTQIMAFQAGELSLVELPPADYARIKADPKFKTYTGLTTSVFQVILNSKISPFNDLKVRQAMYHGINKDEHIQAMGGETPRATQQLTPLTPCYGGPVPEYEFNIEKAKKLLAEAGYPNGFKTLLGIGIAAHHVMSSQIMAANWRKMGVEAEIQKFDLATFMAKRRNGELPCWFDNFTRSPDPDAQWWDKHHSSMYGPGKSPFFGIDEGLEQGRVEMDEKKRCEIYQKLARFHAYETVQSIPVFQMVNFDGLQKYVQNFARNQEHGFSWEHVYLED